MTDKGVFARSGLGVQQTFGDAQGQNFPHAFALHKKDILPPIVLNGVHNCQTVRGCTANYTMDGELYIHCRNGTHTFVVGP